MSRIGLKPIEIPQGVEVKLHDNNLVEVKGPKGTLSEKIDSGIKINIENNVITFERSSEDKKYKSLHGLSRTLVANMIEGVTNGYSKKLIIEGTGYRAQKQGKDLILHLGYSHEIKFTDPEGIETSVPDQLTIVVNGINKQQLGNYAAVLRDQRPPEPYKGKGVRYENEHIRRKVGKTGK